MKPALFRRILGSATLLTAACLLPAQTLQAEAYFDRYGLTPASAALDLGTQPLGYPSGVISAVMSRDRIMQKALALQGHPLKPHPFQRGADMLPLLADKRLEAGLLGDVPTILSASTGDVQIVGLVKQTSTAIVAKGDIQLHTLARKRIGYVDTSSAHHTLLQGLASTKLNESDVTLVPMRVDDMPEALMQGRIDAFAAWEPAPSIALSQSDKNRIIFRGLSSDYFVISSDFEKRSPEAARILTAGFVRAIEWMRRSQKNIETAARWASADVERFSGKPATLPLNQIVAITRREILNVPSAPTIISSPGAPPTLRSEFSFLQSKNKIPQHGDWTKVVKALNYDGLKRIMSDQSKYQTKQFDYAE